MSKLQKTARNVGLAYAAYGHARGLLEDYREMQARRAGARQYNLSINSDESIYEDVATWLASEIPVESQRNVLLKSRHLGGEQTIETRFDSRQVQNIYVDGHKVYVSMQKQNAMRAEDGGYSISLQPDVISFTVDSREGYEAVLDKLKTLARTRSLRERTPQMWTLSNYGDWQIRAPITPRSMESIILKEGQRERIFADLEDFRGAEEGYVKCGMPWHRGYLFYGPPGTGKTSLARALAYKYGMDLYYLPLGDLDKDSRLIGLLSMVRPNSILLLEDIDVFSVAQERDGNSEEQLSLSGLLNALDGILTPNGLVTIMTTNDRDALDTALLRPGRVDVQEELGYVDSSQLERVFQYFYEKPLGIHIEIPERTTPARIISIFKDNLNDADAAVEQLQKLGEYNEQV